MIIKKYIEFINEAKSHRYGYVMAYFTVSNWDEIVNYIVPDDIYKPDEKRFGIQNDPHITLLYGLHKEVTPEMVKNALKGLDTTLNITIKGIDIFQNEEFDVVKFNVVLNDELKNINEALKELPYTSDYDEYLPHVTIAYVKKGTGKKYVKKDYTYTVKNVDKMIYSTASGEKINLNEL